MATVYDSTTASDAWDVMAGDGCFIGSYHVTPYGWFASPFGIEIQLIPCTSRRDACNVVIRLGLHHRDCTHEGEWDNA